MLYQIKDSSKLPIAYASRTLSATERDYAQIEKEALAIVWGCGKFHDYIVGLTVNIETDYRPLVPIFMHKALDGLSPRLQRMKLKMIRYSYEVQYIPGKDLVIADALSRSPIEGGKDEELSEEITAYIQMVIATLPATDRRLSEIWQAHQEDEVCIQLINFVQKSWPEKNALPTHLSRYWEYRHSINIQDGLLMMNARLIIPESMRTEILKAIHEDHFGVTKCRARAKESIWWPGLSTQIERMISSCDSCSKQQVYHKEPMIKSEFPERPWQRVSVDLLKLKGKWYVIVADYYSRFFEVALLGNQKAQTVINHMKSIISRHGIPETELIADLSSQQLSRQLENINYFLKNMVLVL
ncbi:Uncharacterized protein K02A2.6 [Araneus ventricosus]|uniref:RNA-directed DNA polymerase n=1 Tax=Araneus ventricosus TaxID=182803 RepID=A0A4Y2HSV0_ARAVE|nr:Uncharacterized protein K02A2.6 [Araneus ventricosus]